jgi:hypothetical protein
VKKRPILFGKEMILAILAGRKTQTRRIMKEPWRISLPMTIRGDWPFQGTWAAPGIYEAHHNKYGAVSVKATSNEKMLGIKPAEFEWVCPYGQVGDHLRVRESLREGDDGVWVYAADNEPVGCDRVDEGAMLTWAHHKEASHCSSIHMPLWASRITLEVTEVHVERVNDISDEDAMSEGVYEWYKAVQLPHEGWSYWSPQHGSGAASKFKELWNSINGTRPGCSWADNPWVWAIAFKRVKP